MIERKIHEREFATVYKAIDKMLDVPVAIKIVSFQVFSDAKSLDRFKRGIILARKVSSPHACRIYDVGQTEQAIYVSMEYVEGKSIQEILKASGPIAPRIAISIVKQMLEALGEMHERGVIHRNLKPRNVMVDVTNNAYIIDFATSVAPDAARFTNPGELIGTPSYMAPEQFTTDKADALVDLYATGVILYELLTARLPFEGNSVTAIMFARLNSEPVKPSTYATNIAPELERIILKALEKDKARRYQTAQEFLSDLDQLEKSLLSPSPTKLKRFAEWQATLKQAQELFEHGKQEEGRDLVNGILKQISDRRIAPEKRPEDFKTNPQSNEAFLQLEMNRSQRAMDLLKQAITDGRYEQIGEILSNFEEKSLLDTFPAQQAAPVQDPKVAFKTAFEKGKELYDHSRLEEAVEAWKEARTIDPNDGIVQKCIVAAENRLKKEKQIRNEVKELLATCGGNLMKKDYAGAGSILQNCEKLLSTSSRLRMYQEEAKTILQKVAGTSPDSNVLIAELQSLRNKL
jgi:serine/threonine protein kinase